MGAPYKPLKSGTEAEAIDVNLIGKCMQKIACQKHVVVIHHQDPRAAIDAAAVRPNCLAHKLHWVPCNVQSTSGDLRLLQQVVDYVRDVEVHCREGDVFRPQAAQLCQARAYASGRIAAQNLEWSDKWCRQTVQQTQEWSKS